MTQSIDVQLFPGTDTNGDFEWRMKVTPRPSTPAELKVSAHGKCVIKFTINNNSTGPQITFHHDETDTDNNHAFFIPPYFGKNGKDHGIISVDCQDPHTTLTVVDGNKDQMRFPYVLKFIGAPPLDPIVNNGGGGPGHL